MSRVLDVYLYQRLVGKLLQDDGGQMVFDYAESWLERQGAVPLSHSLPLQKKRFLGKQCRGFFAGILPEASQRELIAKNLGISARNDFAMLAEIGGECAGAVTFLPADGPLPEKIPEKMPEKNYCYRGLSDEELADILKALPRRPLLAGDEGVRLSLAGAQDKIAVHVVGDKISVPLDGAPSTHILKPAIERFEGLVFNEALCLSLAEAVGLLAAKASIHSVEGIDYLLVKRYDRHAAKDGVTHRLHQEDFCQALGIVPELKYQNEGGPSLKNCFALVREVSSTPVIDLQRLLDAVIFNFLIGNHDAHSKNFSLLYEKGDASLEGYSVRLAPLYDILSTVYYPELSKKMAMNIGGEYQSDKLSPRHFEKLADEAGLAKPIVKERVAELAEAVLTCLDKIDISHPAAEKVAALIRERCKNILKHFS